MSNTYHIVDESLPGTIVENLLPKCSWSVEVFWSDLRQESDSLASELAMSLVQVDCALAELDGVDRTQVVGSSTLVVVCHRSISLEVAELVGSPGSVNGQLLVVGTNAMSMSVCVRKEAGLKDWIGRRLNTRNEVGRTERNLLDLCEVVDGVLVENELTNLAARKLLLRPNMGKIEDIDLLLLPNLFGLLRSHGLDLNSPLWVVSTLDSFVEILLGVVWGIIGRILLSDELSSLLGLHVDLSIDPVAILIDKLHGVAGVTVHEAVTIRNATVAHQNHDLVDRLWVLGKIVPEHSRIIGMSQMS